MLGVLVTGLLLTGELGAQADARGLVAATGDAATPGTWRAVIVGVSRYTAMPKLSFADNDAEAMYQFLVRRDGGGLDSANVALFLDGRLGFGDISRAIASSLDHLGHLPGRTREDVLAADAAARRHVTELFRC